MKLICEKTQCTGCGLCAAKCPKHCISMVEGELGHLYPFINQNLCIDCGLCQKVCPSQHNIKCSYPLTAYAAWSKDDEDYKSSTSGGMASVLTDYFLSNGGVVYGCTVMPGIEIKHIRIDNVCDACKLKGSKYVQSSINEVFPQLKQDVNNGTQVLFIGTPCQVAAIKQIYKEQPKNLFLVDIICHGVPSNKWLRNYITENLKINKNEVTKVSFRSPNTFSLCIFNNKKLIYKSGHLWAHRYEDLYYNTFIDGFTYRDSCYNCHYAKPERISDICIGDFWGLGKEIDDNYIPKHPYGISCVLAITEKGKDLISAVNNKLNIYERPISEAINGNEQLRHPKNKNWRIEFFRKIQKYIGINIAYQICICDKKLKFRIKNIVRTNGKY